MNYRSVLLAGVAATMAVSFGGFANAANGPAAAAASEQGTVAEVVVTARKRSESLERVPVAITSVQGKALQQAGIRTASDLSQIVPSLTISAGGPSTGGAAALFDLRGQVPSDNLLTIDQAVGLYEDGVNIPHPIGANLAFFDLARVEVLKGPQGTLYGRNTTGGAINIITKAPDFDGVHGFIEGEYGNYNDAKVSGAINLPIIADVLTARIAVQHWNREGFGQSVTTGQHLGDDHDDTIARLSVLFNPTPKVSSQFQVEYDEADRNGDLETPVFNQGTTPDLEAGVELGGSILNPNTAALGAAAIAREENLGMFKNGDNIIGVDNTKVWHLGATIAWDITDNIQLKSITGFHYFKNDRNFDLDGTSFGFLGINAPPYTGATPTSVAYAPDGEDGNLSQEFDLSGKLFDNRLQWLVGGYANWDRGDGRQPFTAFPALQNAGNLLDPFLPAGIGFAEGSHDATSVTNKSWAVFTQDDFHVNDKLSITGGFRYTEEQLGLTLVDYSYNPFTYGSVGPGYWCSNSPAPAITDTLLSSPSACTSKTSASFSGISYLGSINYQITSDILAYFKTSKGFRGGALQARAPGAAAAAPEDATDYEVGLKGEYFDRRLRLNMDAYDTEYSNKQISTIEAAPSGGSYTVVTNAASERIRGFEGDLNAVPIHGLTLNATVTYLDAVYTKYKNALTPNSACSTDPVTGAFSCSDTIANAAGLAAPDPRWHYSLGARYEWPIGPGNLSVEADWSWISKTISNALTLDESGGPALVAIQEKLRAPIGLLNGRLDYAVPHSGFTVSLFVTNMLDKHYQVLGLQGSALGGITTGVTQDPRMYGIVVRKSFGGGGE